VGFDKEFHSVGFDFLNQFDLVIGFHKAGINIYLVDGQPISEYVEPVSVSVVFEPQWGLVLIEIFTVASHRVILDVDACSEARNLRVQNLALWFLVYLYHSPRHWIRVLIYIGSIVDLGRSCRWSCSCGARLVWSLFVTICYTLIEFA
jgi:hypothetical protein